MAQPDKHEVLRPTILDRLIAKDSSASFEGVSVRELKASVARDVEWLLNTRVWVPWNLEGFEEARTSLLAYGLPDLSTYSWAEVDHAKSVGALIEECIRRFEPRIQPRSVHCDVERAEDISNFELRVRIEAVLHVEPILEPVVFDSGLDLAAGSIRIESFT